MPLGAICRDRRDRARRARRLKPSDASLRRTDPGNELVGLGFAVMLAVVLIVTGAPWYWIVIGCVRDQRHFRTAPEARRRA
jgi:hypothetical protein